MIRFNAAFNGNLSGPRRFKTGNPVVRTVRIRWAEGWRKWCRKP